jgi:hypothetical protein
MKVVINRKYGGFGLSNKAIKDCIALGMEGLSGPDGQYYCECENSKAFRCDLRLIQVVEQLGNEANGDFASLRIVEIPFDTTDGWGIYDYDGMERIEESHSSWC